MKVNQTDKNLDSNQKPKSNKKIILIIFSILAVICVITFIVIKYVYNKTQEDHNNQIELSFEEKQAAMANLFSVAEYDAIPNNYKEHIYHFMEYNDFLDGTYFLTKISDRAKKVFAFGDFTSDNNDEDDMAILLESNDFKSSKLVVFNHKGELLYVEDYEYDLPIINSFKVGSKIFMDDIKLVPSPCDGLIIKTEYNKRALVYNKKAKKFETYHQFSQDEIDSIENEREYNEQDYYEEEPPKPDSTMQEDIFTIQEVS
nr:hypothetical protein [uncultured Flavobacterium sp.]